MNIHRMRFKAGAAALSLVTLVCLATLIDAEMRLRSIRNIKFDGVQLVNSETKPDKALEQAILKEFPNYARSFNSTNSLPARYFYNKVDLNGDGRPEIIAYLVGSFFCGTGGCTMLVLQPASKSYALIGMAPITQQPIIVTDQQTRGWKDVIRVTAGGGAPLNYSYLRYQGSRYQEGAPVAAKTVVTGRALIADDITPAKGIVLKPN